MSEAQKKEKRIQSYLKYCKSEKGKKARQRALKKYYEKNKVKMIAKQKAYYTDTYSKVIGDRKGKGIKKGANFKIEGDHIIKLKKKFKHHTLVNVAEESKYVILDKDTNKLMSMTVKEIRESQKKNNSLRILISFD